MFATSTTCSMRNRLASSARPTDAPPLRCRRRWRRRSAEQGAPRRHADRAAHQPWCPRRGDHNGRGRWHEPYLPFSVEITGRAGHRHSHRFRHNSGARPSAGHIISRRHPRKRVSPFLPNQDPHRCKLPRQHRARAASERFSATCSVPAREPECGERARNLGGAISASKVSASADGNACADCDHSCSPKRQQSARGKLTANRPGFTAQIGQRAPSWRPRTASRRMSSWVSATSAGWHVQIGSAPGIKPDTREVSRGRAPTNDRPTNKVPFCHHGWPDRDSVDRSIANALIKSSRWADSICVSPKILCEFLPS